MLENEQSSYAGVASVFDPDSTNDYGFYPAGPFPVEDDDYQVAVLVPNVQISDQQIAALSNRCNPLQEDDRSG